MIDRFNKISSVILLTMVAESLTKPMNFKNTPQIFNIQDDVVGKVVKRSPNPLKIGYVSFGISPFDEDHHFHSGTDPNGVMRQLVPNFPLQVQEAISSSAIKSETVHRGPFVSNGAVINLAGHEIHQTHDHPKDHETHIVVPVNNHPAIVPQTIAVIHGLTPSVSRTKKTSITSKVSHVITSDNQSVPVVTHHVTNSEDSISHFPDHFVPIIPVASHVIITSHAAKSGLVATHNGLVNEGLEKVNDDHPVALAQHSNDDDRDRFRDMVGGYGAGLTFGGQGAGHGFYAG